MLVGACLTIALLLRNCWYLKGKFKQSYWFFTFYLLCFIDMVVFIILAIECLVWDSVANKYFKNVENLEVEEIEWIITLEKCLIKTHSN